ncbi:Zinc finger BED domain-containing protein 4 [Labeo rohita]|uniref:Zinc finger BED domain-containing protein 4 n=1 Tax=Labeo rohita TaxID=84645 RepID=A0ABQ8L4P7_LABRO|nr:Zinc finger BED domain-containing protein 4 [Labeo rohita]
MRPFSVAENLGFRRLIHTLEPKYAIPSRAHFTHTVVPSLYKECKVNIVQALKEAETIAITTDGANIAEVLQEAVTEWDLKKRNHCIAIVTDNAGQCWRALRWTQDSRSYRR